MNWDRLLSVRSRSFFNPLGTESHPAEKASDSGWQPLDSVHRMHDHLPGRRDRTSGIGGDRLCEHFRLAGLLKFHDRGDLRDANLKHLETVRLKCSDITADGEMGYETISRNRLVNMEFISIEPRCRPGSQGRWRFELEAVFAAAVPAENSNRIRKQHLRTLVHGQLLHVS